MLKNSLLFIIKISLAITLLAWLYYSDAMDFSVLRHLSLDQRTVTLLGINACLLAFGTVLLSYRMWKLLRLLDFALPFGEALRVNLAAMCLGIMLPGLLGVDAIRATYFCMQTEERKVDAFSAILFDRIVGLYALMLLAFMATCLGWLVGLEQIHSGFVFFTGGILMVATIGIGLLASETLQHMQPFAFFFRLLPNVFKGIIDAIQRFTAFRWPTLQLLLVSMASQCITIGCFVFMALIIRDSLPVLAHFIFNPLALFLNAVPLTPGGLGITESAFAYLYQTADSNNGAVISLLGRINYSLVYIIVGLPALMLVRWRPGSLTTATSQ